MLRLIIWCWIGVAFFTIGVASGDRRAMQSPSLFYGRMDHYHQPTMQEEPTERIEFEPGFWRPRWIMDRKFFAEDGEPTGKSDRFYFKMNNDRSITILSAKSRRLLDWFKFREKKTQIFEPGEESAAPSQSKWAAQRRKQLNSMYNNADGSWSWTDEDIIGVAKVVIETKEGPNKLKILHEIRADWGKMDGYAALFRRGNIFRYQGMKYETDLPLGKYLAGHFTIRANVHRPLVSKDFQAFQ